MSKYYLYIMQAESVVMELACELVDWDKIDQLLSTQDGVIVQTILGQSQTENIWGEW